MVTTQPTAVNQRQMVYWRLLSALFGQNEQTANLDAMTLELASALGLPALIADLGDPAGCRTALLRLHRNRAGYSHRHAG